MLNEAPEWGASDARVLSSDCVYDGFFRVDRLSVQHRLFEGGWSEPLTRECVRRPSAVVVLPYDPVR